MKATLYLPSQPPVDVSTEELSIPDPATGFAKVSKRVSTLLGCIPELVDVLACGPGYVTYSVFDCEGDINLDAMAVVTKATGVRFDADDEDTILLGPVLMVE